jgi:hypothetical protein
MANIRRTFTKKHENYLVSGSRILPEKVVKKLLAF